MDNISKVSGAGASDESPRSENVTRATVFTQKLDKTNESPETLKKAIGATGWFAGSKMGIQAYLKAVVAVFGRYRDFI